MATIRLIIVDDVCQVRTDLRTLLGLVEGVEIIGEAKNGEEAITLTSRLTPDVILMDLEMPVMDGFEATRLIKSRLPTCRVIALTVHDYKKAKDKAIQAGMDGYLVKGVSLAELLQEINARGVNDEHTTY